MQNLKPLLIAITFLSLTACCTPITISEVVKVPILPMPVLPTLTQAQQNELPEDTYLTLVERDERWRQHVIKINKILEAHNEQR